MCDYLNNYIVPTALCDVINYVVYIVSRSQQSLFVKIFFTHGKELKWRMTNDNVFYPDYSEHATCDIREEIELAISYIEMLAAENNLPLKELCVVLRCLG
ncbi:hypothetical protein CEXT_30381 [Caerostris extrusa]|uniref:Uncharacterized protein n=1 Tax=Caerostris extrusa TaxID=172846 RepID=A0AAV4QNV7_CAEEX|nr:hypothetical protein CEXT_30381 [Caerostris extrusa]